MSDYNGWTNYETWAVNLWMGNDSGSYDWATALAFEAWKDAKATTILTRSEEARYRLASYLKDHFGNEENCPLLGEANVYTDLLNAALSEVNWQEIAGAWLKQDELLKPDDGDEAYQPTA